MVAGSFIQRRLLIEAVPVSVARRKSSAAASACTRVPMASGRIALPFGCPSPCQSAPSWNTPAQPLNPLAIIATTRLYEVQKTCSLTGHVWDGYWVLANKRAFKALPENIQQVISAELDKSAIDERADIAKLSQTLKADLSAKGITFIDVNQDDFRAALGGTDFYATWKDKYGDDAWALLEQVSGKLG